MWFLFCGATKTAVSNNFTHRTTIALDGRSGWGGTPSRCFFALEYIILIGNLPILSIDFLRINVNCEFRELLWSRKDKCNNLFLGALLF